MLEHRAIPGHVLDPTHRELWEEACGILERNARVTERPAKEDSDVPSRNTDKTWSWGPEAAEESLNTLIERRAKEADDANHYAQARAESVRRYNLRVATERREQWRRFHTDMSVVHSRIAAEHRQKAALLSDIEGEGP